MHDNIETAHLGEAKLIVLDAGKANLLPGTGRVGLAGRVDGSLKLLQVNEGNRQTTIVGHIVVENTGRLVELIVEAPVANLANVSVVGTANELLQVRQAVRLCVGVNQLRLNVRLTGLLASHLQKANQVLPAVCTVGSADDVHVDGRFARLDERVNRLLDEVLSQLCLSKERPHGRLIAPFGKLVSAVKIFDVLNEHLNRRGVHLKLLEDGKGLFVQFRGDGNVGNVGGVVVVEAVDVLHDTRSVSLDGSQNEQILQIAMVREDRVVEDNLFEQLNQLIGQIGCHEGLHSDGDVFGVLRLRESSLDNLISKINSECVSNKEKVDHTWSMSCRR